MSHTSRFDSIQNSPNSIQKKKPKFKNSTPKCCQYDMLQVLRLTFLGSKVLQQQQRVPALPML